MKTMVLADIHTNYSMLSAVLNDAPDLIRLRTNSLVRVLLNL